MNILQAGSDIGPYRIEGDLGEGGMAQVFKVWHSELHRFEALKVPVARGAVASQGEQVFIARFLQEARLAAGLSHPHIATVYGVSPAGAPQPYFAMELIEGIDLAALLKREGRLTPAEALAILEPVADALDYAHSQGVIHRDIKPANVLLKAQGAGWFPKVVDFGIGRAADVDGRAGRTRLTQAGSVVGTPEYMSPEQAEGKDDTGHQSDTYSLGVVAYEMLCGRPPFVAAEGASSISVLIQHLHDTPPRPSSHDIGLSEPLGEVLLWALAKQPADRPNSCQAFVQALRQAAPASGSQDGSKGNEGNEGNEGNKGRDTTKPVNRALVAAGLCALLVVGAMGLYVAGRSRPMVSTGTTIVTAPPDPGIKLAAEKVSQAAASVDEGAAATQEVQTGWRNKTMTKSKAIARLKEQPPKFAKARKLAAEAMKLDPENPEARYQYCRSLYYLSDAGAATEIDTAIRKSPKDSRLKLLQTMNQESMRSERKP